MKNQIEVILLYMLHIEILDLTEDNESNEFLDNEVLQTVEDISFATTFIAAGEGFASTIAQDAAVTGMAYIMI